MKLKDWMKENRWSVKSFAEHIGVSRLTIDRALNKVKGTLTIETMMMIEKSTNGKVKCKDLFPRQEESKEKKNKKNKDKEENSAK